MITLAPNERIIKTPMELCSLATDDELYVDGVHWDRNACLYNDNPQFWDNYIKRGVVAARSYKGLARI